MTWQNKGFTIKQREPHKNSIHNALIEFEDQTEIELITVTEAKDELSTKYMKKLKTISSEAPVFVAFKITDY